MARGKEVDRQMVDLVLSMKAHNEKLTTEQIGTVVQCDPTTAGRIIRSGSWEAFCEMKAEKAKKERERNRKPAETQTIELYSAGEKIAEIEGQIEMDLKEPEKAEHDETLGEMQTKMMRFQAAQVDKLIMKMDQLNNTMSMVLRAVRGE